MQYLFDVSNIVAALISIQNFQNAPKCADYVSNIFHVIW